MLTLFRNNQSTTVFILAAYVAVLHLPAMLGWVSPAAPIEGIDPAGGLLFETLFGWCRQSARLSAVVAAGLVLVQAILVNNLADTYRLMNDRNWLPGALYALCASCLPEFLFVGPALVAVTFLPLAMRSIFGVYKQSLAFGAIFDGAFWIAIAALFHPVALWCLPVGYFAYFNLRSFPAREQLVFTTGIFAPFFLALTSFFWYDQADAFFGTQFDLLGWPSASLPADLYNSIKTALLGLLIVVTLLGFGIYYHKKLIQIQKYITILYWFMFAGLISALFCGQWRVENLLLAIPTVGIFLSYQFQSTRNYALVEFFHLLLLIGIFALQFYPR